MQSDPDTSTLFFLEKIFFSFKWNIRPNNRICIFSWIPLSWECGRPSKTKKKLLSDILLWIIFFMGSGPGSGGGGLGEDDLRFHAWQLHPVSFSRPSTDILIEALQPISGQNPLSNKCFFQKISLLYPYISRLRPIIGSSWEERANTENNIH